MSEDFCGVQMDVSHRETRSGTQYSINKWTCPTCSKECSYMELDGEWSHGDGLVISFRDGQSYIRCCACWLETKP